MNTGEFTQDELARLDEAPFYAEPSVRVVGTELPTHGRLAFVEVQPADPADGVDTQRLRDDRFLARFVPDRHDRMLCHGRLVQLTARDGAGFLARVFPPEAGNEPFVVTDQAYRPRDPQPDPSLLAEIRRNARFIDARTAIWFTVDDMKEFGGEFGPAMKEAGSEIGKFLRKMQPPDPRNGPAGLDGPGDGR